MIQILIIDDQALVRTGLRRILDQSKQIAKITEESSIRKQTIYPFKVQSIKQPSTRFLQLKWRANWAKLGNPATALSRQIL